MLVSLFKYCSKAHAQDVASRSSSEYYLKRLGCEKITPWVGICNSKRANNSIVEFETANPPEVFA
jgi:hypothetical protein